MEQSVAPAKAKSARKNYIDSFAALVNTFAATRKEEILAQVPALMVESFDAARGELWLADDSSKSAYLVHSAGRQAEHRHDYATFGSGAIGKVIDAKAPLENLLLSTCGSEEQEFVGRTGLDHICCYPIKSADHRLLAILIAYSNGSVDTELLSWWRLYAEMSALKVADVLLEQEQQKQITQLSLLFEATRLLNSTLDLAELLDDRTL